MFGVAVAFAPKNPENNRYVDRRCGKNPGQRLAAIADNRATRQERTGDIWLKYMGDLPEGPEGGLVLAISAAVAAWAGGPADGAADLAE